MFCTNCGKEIPDVSKFCPYCGFKQEEVVAVAPTSAPLAEGEGAAEETRLPGPTIVTPAEEIVEEDSKTIEPGSSDEPKDTQDTKEVVEETAKEGNNIAELEPGNELQDLQDMQNAQDDADSSQEQPQEQADISSQKQDALADAVINEQPQEQSFNQQSFAQQPMGQQSDTTGQLNTRQPYDQQAYNQQQYPGQPYDQQQLAGQPYPGQQPYGQPPYAQQQPYQGQQYGATAIPQQAFGYGQQAPVKKRSKLPFIIIGAVVVLALIGAAIAIALNFFAPKSMFDTVSQSTENLVYNNGSADMEIEVNAAGQSVDMSLKWDLGSDLKSSTIWVDYAASGSQAGIIIKDDKASLYAANPMASNSSYMIISEQSGIVELANQALKEEYNVDVDINGIVKNGKFDKAYAEDLGNKLNEALAEETLGSYSGVATEADKITEILVDFMSKELTKKDVQDKFMSEVVTQNSGSTTTYETSIDIVDLFRVLGEYAKQRGATEGYSEAAGNIEDICAQVEGLGIGGDVELKITTQGDLLSEMDVSLAVAGQRFAFNLSVLGTESSGFSLDNNTELENILNSESLGGSLGGSLPFTF